MQAGGALASPGGGWGWAIAGEVIHGVGPRTGLNAPFLPQRHLGIVHATMNDLAMLGSQKPLPMQTALRSLICGPASSSS